MATNLQRSVEEIPVATLRNLVESGEVELEITLSSKEN